MPASSKSYIQKKVRFAKDILGLRLSLNWSKTQTVAFENVFQKKRFTNSCFIIISASALLMRNIRISFQTYIKQDWAVKAECWVDGI